MGPIKRHNVNNMVRTCYWEGYFGRLGGQSKGIATALEYTTGPRWWNDVKKIAQAAGWEEADRVIAALATPKRIAVNRASMEVPNKVYMAAYAAASRPSKTGPK